MTKREEWAKRAEKELRGKTIDDLTWQTLEDIKVKPVYFEEEIRKVFLDLVLELETLRRQVTHLER